jgi:Questin oxidase-like
LEEYIFESRANFAGKDDQPEMLNRFHDGLLHPHIHTGFGVEFGLPGTFAEGNLLFFISLEFTIQTVILPGLAETAVCGPSSSPVIPSSWFDESETGLVSWFTSAVGLADKGLKTDIHAFTILARVLADPALTPLQFSEDEFYEEMVKNHGDHIVKYVNEWSLDGDLDKKVEELLWTNVLIYAVGGSEEEGTFNADFFQ